MTTIKTYDLATHEEIERDMTAAELAQQEIDKSDAESKAQAEEAKAAAKSALLDKLGISEAEAKLLLS